MKLAGKIFRNILPRPISYSLNAFKILSLDYGHLRSIFSKQPVDNSGKPLPWYTYPAIEYIKQLDFSEKKVFEYGAGNSSFFWASRAKQVISVESDAKWYEKLKIRKPENLEILYLKEESDSYVKKINDFDNFDVIIIDGKRRKECSFEALRNIRDGGMIVLDNSDWFGDAAGVLGQENDLIQVDMTGFTPINFYTSTTSFFLKKDFSIASRATNQPIPGPGAYL